MLEVPDHGPENGPVDCQPCATYEPVQWPTRDSTKIAKPPAIVSCPAALAIALIAEFFHEKIADEVGFTKVILPDVRFFPEVLFCFLNESFQPILFALGAS